MEQRLLFSSRSGTPINMIGRLELCDRLLSSEPSKSACMLNAD
jgi:hypothetical protein